MCMCVCLHALVFVIVGKTAGPLETKLGTRIYLDPGSVLGKSGSWSRSSSKHRRRDSGGVVGTERDRNGANAVGMKIETP